MSNLIDEYASDLIYELSNLDRDTINEITLLVELAIKEKKTIFMIGNGGSSATPSHSSGDFSKELGAKVLCLTDNTPAVTAWANDSDYSNIFLGQLESFMEMGDLVMAYSGSGNSPNVVNGIRYAKENGAQTIAITGNYNGKGGGKIVEIADFSLIFKTKSMERIEDMQLILNHIIKESIKERMGNEI